MISWIAIAIVTVTGDTRHFFWPTSKVYFSWQDPAFLGDSLANNSSCLLSFSTADWALWIFKEITGFCFSFQCHRIQWFALLCQIIIMMMLTLVKAGCHDFLKIPWWIWVHFLLWKAGMLGFLVGFRMMRSYLSAPHFPGCCDNLFLQHTLGKSSSLRQLLPILA